jgi:hypothetical protein
MQAGQAVASARVALVLVACAAVGVSGARAQAEAECLGFAEQAVVEGGTNGVTSVAVQDLDGDGDPDIISASFGDDKVFWYRNDATKGIDDPARFEPRLISDRVFGAADVSVADISGDGHPDLVAAARTSNSVIWFEQAPGDPPLFTARTIATDARLVLGVHAADVDGDGRVDVLSASYLDDTVAWYEHVPPPDDSPYEPPTFTKHVIAEDAVGAASVFAAHLNADTRLDVLSASRLDDTVAWYEHVPAAPGAEDPTPSFVKHVIHDDVAGATAVVAADLDRDGDLDVIAAAQAADAIYWWPNNGGAFDKMERKTLDGTVGGPIAVAVADLNGDGAPDVISASYRDDTIAWYENDCTTPPCGVPSFTRHVVSTAAVHANDVAAGHLDGGGVDLVSASSLPGFPASQDKLAWYRDVAAALPGLPEERRISRSADGAVSAFAVDLDRDGDVDVATAGRTNRITWFENDGAPKPAFAEIVVSLDAVGAVDVHAADLDLDGDEDLVSASSGDDKIAWYENGCDTQPPMPCGSPLSFTERPVPTTTGGVQDLFVIDLDGDLDPDILSASSADGMVAWYENDCAQTACAPPTFTEQVITEDDPNADPPVVTGARGVHAANIGGDGDLDVLAALYEANRIRWYEREEPPSTAWVEHEVLDPSGGQFILFGATSIFGADLDGDGDTDLVATAATGRLVAWFESDGAEPPALPAFTSHVLASDANDASSAGAVDLDGDTDLDIVAAVPGDAVIAWFESDLTQTEGAETPTFAIHVVAQTDFALSTSVADVNGDMLKDIVAGQRLAVSWFEASDEICQDFDVNGDDMLDGIELAYIGRAFGLSSSNPETEWWGKADLNRDGKIDGDDLAYLASPGVFGSSTMECSFICR